MAFEVTAKKETKKFDGWNIIFFFSLVLLIAAVLSFFIFTYYIEEANKEIGELDRKIANQEQENQELKNNLKAKKKIIDNFSLILSHHKLTNQVFPLIEKITHQEVVFTEFVISPENYQIELSGRTTNFQTLGEQILILKNNNEISDFNLLEVSSKPKDLDYIEFFLNIYLSPQVFILSSQ